MVLLSLLNGLHYEGQISLRRKGKEWFEYLATSQKKMKYWYGYYEVLSSCVIDGVLVIYVE